MMDRTFTDRQNAVIVEKAIRYQSRGIVGVDIAGPRPDGARFDYTRIRPMVEAAREAGLGITIHTGEEGGAFGLEEMIEVVEELRPDRIGHGILCASDDSLMQELVERDIVLELCPTSNLLTKALADQDALNDTLHTLLDRGVPITIATDGPEMMRTHLKDELELLLRIGAATEDQLRAANARAHAASFIA
jgi:adenosine deaminase